MANILIIDDDPGICYILARTIEKMEHKAFTCHGLHQAETLMREHTFDVLLLDVCLPDGNGLAGIERMAAHPSSPEIIVITGLGIPEDAAKAINSGAWDYIQKTASPRAIMEAVQQALSYRCQKQNTPASAHAIQRDGIVGNSAPLLQCLSAMQHMAKGEGNVLIYGETGTGKEAFARAIHNNSPRWNKPFVIVDCGSLPDKLVESILFGHVRGAFTGADRDAPGLVREADGGTLFLDEVGELPPQVQSSFLRVLQQRTYRSVGSLVEKRSDFRLVAATNRHLEDMAAQGLFRKDLLFRLRGAFLTLPPLCQRKEDISHIAVHYIRQHCQRLGMPEKKAAPEFLAFLADYSWPGNVRELVNTIEFAVNAAQHEGTLFHAHLPRELRARVLQWRVDGPTKERSALPPQEELTPQEQGAAAPIATSPPVESDFPPLPVVSQFFSESSAYPSAPLSLPPFVVTMPTSLMPPGHLPPLAQVREQAQSQAERAYIEQLMRQAHNDMHTACNISGLSQSRLYALLKKHDLATPGWRKS